MESPFDFNKTPMSILGTNGLAFLSPDDRATWQPHGVDIFYTGRKHRTITPWAKAYALSFAGNV